MRAIARNQDGLWSPAEATLAVVSAAAWWQTWWAALGALLGFTVLVIWGVRYVSHRRLKRRLGQLERENALERERARIARDLHDELGGSLTQIRLLAERIKRHADQPDFKDSAGQLAWRARRLGRELESIIWTVSPKNNAWDRLASFIGQYALKFFRDSPVICDVQGADRVPALPLRPEEQHNLLAVAKEALNNILKHAQATRATLALSADDGRFELRIADDGGGFDPESGGLAACNGLNNMRARMREIGGEILIESAPGRGTVITVRQPMRARPGPRPRPPVPAERDSTLV
jgi:signal transduction histidine kinase